MESWKDRILRWLPKKREATLDHAVRLITGNGASPSEKETAKQQIHAALDIDANALFSIIVSVMGEGTSQDDVAKAQREAAEAVTNFQGLVKGVQTLRAAMLEAGIVSTRERLPETVEQWRAAVARVVERDVQPIRALRRSLEQQGSVLEQQRQDLDRQQQNLVQRLQQYQQTLEQDLRQQRRVLETERDAALKQVAAAEAHAKLKVFELQKLSSDFFAGLTSGFGVPAERLKALALDYNSVQTREHGKFYENEGIFTTLWVPQYADGNRLSIECEVFAAKKDLKEVRNAYGPMTYIDSVKAVAALRNLDGHEGGDFANENAIVDGIDKAVKRYVKQRGQPSPGVWFQPAGVGRWLIPPLAILNGRQYNKNGNKWEKISDDNLYDLRDVGEFENNFIKHDADTSNYYWSSTKSRQNESQMEVVRFSDGDLGYTSRHNVRLSCRPVRVGRIRHLAV